MAKTSMDTRMFSRWSNGKKSCTLISKVIKEGNQHKQLWAFEGWNPLPVKGWFESSYPVLKAWLESNGWENISNQSNTYIISCTVRETVYEIDI